MGCCPNIQARDHGQLFATVALFAHATREQLVLIPPASLLIAASA